MRIVFVLCQRVTLHILMAAAQHLQRRCGFPGVYRTGQQPDAGSRIKAITFAQQAEAVTHGGVRLEIGAAQRAAGDAA